MWQHDHAMTSTPPLGDLLADLRKRAGLTQEQLADRAIISSAMIAHVERGKRSLGVDSRVTDAHDDVVMPDPADLIALEPDDVDDPLRIAELRTAHEVEQHLRERTDP